MSLYLSQLSFALLFCFWQEKTGDMKHFPIFLSLTRLVKTSQREEVCHFSLTANQQKITASLHWRDHLSLKGPNSSSTFFETPEMNVLKGHQEHILYSILKLQHLAISTLFSRSNLHFPFLFFSYYMLNCYGSMSEISL